eukprot:6953889-Pyramimonas_sp.AAC.1
MASGRFQWSDEEPGAENVKWKVADCKMCLLTLGNRGLKPSFCARHRSLSRCSAQPPWASEQSLKKAPLCVNPSPQIQHVTGGEAAGSMGSGAPTGCAALLDADDETGCAALFARRVKSAGGRFAASSTSAPRASWGV